MEKIAIFSAPKPFKDPHISMIQRNAIMNWKALGPKVEIWLVGSEEGVADIAREYQVNHLPDVECNASGTPRIDSIFNLVRQHSQASVLAYVNADILLLPDFIQTAEEISATHKRFLLVGQRRDLLVTESLDFEPGWDQNLWELALTKGKAHRPAGSDYFIFSRDMFTDIPTFAVGRAGWDNWMIYAGRVDHIPVIDATQAIHIIHQNHDYSHLTGGIIHRRQPETLENIKLMGGRFAVYTLYDADYQIRDGKVTRTPLTRWKLVREISIFPAVTLKSPFLAKISYFLFNMKRAMQDSKKDRSILMEQK